MRRARRREKAERKRESPAERSGGRSGGRAPKAPIEIPEEARLSPRERREEGGRGREEGGGTMGGERKGPGPDSRARGKVSSRDLTTDSRPYRLNRPEKCHAPDFQVFR